MGSTQSQESNAGVSRELMPFVNQGSNYISRVSAAAPDYSNFLASPGGQMAHQLGQGQFAPGGSAQLANQFQQNVLGGQFLNPGSNPYLQGVLDQNYQQYQRSLGGGLDSLSSYLNLTGQSPTGSGVFANAAGNLARNSMADYNGQTSNLLYGNYQTGLQQMLALLGSGNAAAQFSMGGLGLADLPNTLALQQMQANAIPANLYTQFLGSLPVSRPMYGPSQFAQNFGMAAQGTQALAQAGMAYAML